MKRGSVSYRSNRLPKLMHILERRPPVCAMFRCTNKPWYGFPGMRAMYCNLHTPSGTMTFPERTCSFKGCHALARFGTSMNRMCGHHIMISDDAEPSMTMMACFSCGNIEQWLMHEPRFYVDRRLCRDCAIKPIMSRNSLDTVLHHEGVAFERCGNELSVTSVSGVRVVIQQVSGTLRVHDVHRKDLVEKCRAAHDAQQATIVIMYMDTYTSGKFATADRHDVLLDVLMTLLALPQPSPFNLFRTLHLHYDGYRGVEMPLKSMI
jgi:hypothetical protein